MKEFLKHFLVILVTGIVIMCALGGNYLIVKDITKDLKTERPDHE